MCSAIDVPEHLRNNFRNPSGKLIVKWFGEKNYSLVKKARLLGENGIDAQRGSSNEMQRLYGIALEELQNE